MSDITLTCSDCSVSFIFTAGEQEFFSLKGLINTPKRCPSCRIVARCRRAGKEVEVTSVDCAECGAPTAVPFQPKGHKPVYCNVCFKAKQVAVQAS